LIGKQIACPELGFWSPAPGRSRLSDDTPHETTYFAAQDLALEEVEFDGQAIDENGMIEVSLP
jgi:hypothetical protein